MEKAELGSRIATETAASLDEIVDGINESNQIVREISVSSSEQYESIHSINVGVEKVAHIVQQNSATAEESAAASLEMRNQSAMLEKLIAQFQLRDKGSGSNNELPPHG
jgi:methyl-accepting chemotaxis protein